MANVTNTGIIKSITPIGNGQYRILLEEGSFFITQNNPLAGNFTFSTVNTSSLLLNPYINTPNITYSDYNATLGNATDIRPGTLYQDIDYSSNATTPVNFNQLISGSATKANIPDSNYSTKRITTPRYEGSRSTSNDFNLSSNEGGLGSLPNVEQDRAYFTYFNWVGGTAPEWGNGLEDRSALSIRYFIDSEGNVIEPTNDSNGVNLSIIRQTFTEGETGVLSFDDENGISPQFQNLVGEQTIFKSGKSIIPIAYSQTQSISDTTPGGFTGSLTFVQGDQAESILGDYRSTAYSTPQFITDTNVPFTVLFPSQQYLGGEGSFTLNSIYSSSIDASPDVTLKFEAYIETGITTQNGSSAVFHIQKNSSGAGWVNVSSGVNVLEPGVRNSIAITYTDPNSTANDDYRVRVTSANINTGTGPVGYIDINSTSYFKITQTPPPNIGDVGPSGSLAQSRYWQKVGGAPTKIKPNALMAVYGQKQKDIIEDINGDSVGFSSITNDFILQVGDEIRFQGTETQTYKIIEIDNTPANGDPLHLILDKEVNLTNVEMDWFLVRRYVDTPGQIIIEADKPAGGTSPGFFMPLYATKGIEDNFDKVIQKLKTDQLI